LAVRIDGRGSPKRMNDLVRRTEVKQRAMIHISRELRHKSIEPCHCEKNRLAVGAKRDHVVSTILLLVRTGQFMPRDDAADIVRHIHAAHQSTLRPSLCGLPIDIKVLPGLAHHAAAFQQSAEIVEPSRVHAWRVRILIGSEVHLGTHHAHEAVRIGRASHGSCEIDHVIGGACHL